MVNIKGIHHLAIKCHGMESFEKTVGFYSKTLGLPIVRNWGEGADAGIMIDTGSGILEIFANGDGSTGTTLAHFAFDVENTDACIEAARSAGLEITMEPTDICISSDPPYPARIGFCIGFAGEEIEFFQVK